MSLTIKSECGNAIYKVKKGMILERINPYSKQKYFKVVHNPRLKRGNSYYLSCVRSEYPDVFPEFCAASERNGDTVLVTMRIKGKLKHFRSLAGANDGGASFKRIATWIEKNYKLL